MFEAYKDNPKLQDLNKARELKPMKEMQRIAT
jgi:hypothetical protein